MALRAKIATLLAGLAAVVLIVGLSRGGDGDATAGRTPTPVVATAVASAVSPTPASTATPTPAEVPATGAATPVDPLSLTADSRRRWEPVVRGFGGAFTQKKLSRSQWRTALDPYAEAAVRTDLRTYERKQVPDQRYVGYDVIDAADADVTVQVGYDDGWALVLYLHTPDQQRWLVHAYDRLEE